MPPRASAPAPIPPPKHYTAVQVRGGKASSGPKAPGGSTSSIMAHMVQQEQPAQVCPTRACTLA